MMEELCGLLFTTSGVAGWSGGGVVRNCFLPINPVFSLACCRVLGAVRGVAGGRGRGFTLNATAHRAIHMQMRRELRVHNCEQPNTSNKNCSQTRSFGELDAMGKDGKSQLGFWQDQRCDRSPRSQKRPSHVGICPGNLYTRRYMLLGGCACCWKDWATPCPRISPFACP
jgi:hypothetical protein